MASRPIWAAVPIAAASWLMRSKFRRRRAESSRSGQVGTTTIGDALTEWQTGGRRDAIMRISDNRSYAEPIAVNVAGATGNTLAIEAADGRRPHLRLQGTAANLGQRARLLGDLSGLLSKAVSRSMVRWADYGSCTRRWSRASDRGDDPPSPPLPVEPSITAAAMLPTGDLANTELAVQIAFSVIGPVRLPPRPRA